MRNSRPLRSLLPVMLLFISTAGPAQTADYDEVVNQYVERFKYIAIQEMKQYGIPASITLAQGILESNAGRSTLAVKANNHFGIKCHKEWTGPSVYQDDDKANECFRKYDDPLDSYRDHSLFLTTRDRYKGLFALKPDDYKAWAEGLKAAGYATNPKYPELLIRTIERFSLHQYDRSGPFVAPLPSVSPPSTGPAFRDIRYAYFAPGPDGRKTFINNHTLFTFAGSGDNLKSVSGLFGIPEAKLRRYNDLPKGRDLREGDPVYLAKKRARAEVKSHKMAAGQSLWEISQIYAVRLGKLYRLNGLDQGMDPAAGTVILLR